MKFRFLRWRPAALAITALVAANGTSVQGCARQEAPPRPIKLTFVTGSAGSDNDRLGKVLAKKFASNILGAVVTTKNTNGTVFNIQSIQQGNADIGFAHADFAYVGYKRGTENQRTRARGIAVLFTSAVQIIVREDSDIRAVSDLRNHRVAIGAFGHAIEVAAHAIFASYGLRPSNLDLRELDDTDDRVSLLKNRSVDGGIFLRSGLIDATNTAGFRLIGLDHKHINLIRGGYPFYKPVTIPQGTYPNQKSDIHTIGIDTLMVCREDLPEELVYQLTRVFFESLPDVKQVQPYADFVDREQGPASSIPLHPGAARFYRERELER